MIAPRALDAGRTRRVRVVLDRAWRRIAVVSFVAALAVPVGFLLGFRYVVTSSVPKGLWFVHGGTIARGEYALVCLPADIATLGRKAGYLLRGFCPGDALPLMKRVIALGGDTVAVDAAGIHVNGELVAGSRRLRVDSRGRAIPGHVSPTPVTLQPGTIWVLGDWFKSWDSRYFGGIAQARVIGIGVPLVTTPAGS